MDSIRFNGSYKIREISYADGGEKYAKKRINRLKDAFEWHKVALEALPDSVQLSCGLDTKEFWTVVPVDCITVTYRLKKGGEGRYVAPIYAKQHPILRYQSESPRKFVDRVLEQIKFLKDIAE